MRFVFALFSLAVVLFSIDVEGWPANLGASPAAAAGNSAAQGRPFEELQGQIDALNAQVATLGEETPVPLRVFDGEGNDLGLYTGRDTQLDPNGPIHVFFEDAGVTASYSPQGFLHPIDPTAVRYESDDCTGPAFYDVAGVAGRSRDGAFLFRVMVAGTVTQEVLVGSRVGEAPRIGPVCVLFSPPIPTPLVPVQFFDPADVDIPIQVAPVLMVAPAE
jgi:hypothetical protein